jgi:arginine/ornithine N-succinyltransferase beta subunit
VAIDPPTLRVRNEELRTVREAMRDFGTMIGELEGGGVEKLVITQRNQMRAVVVSVERWSELERALEARTIQADELPGESTGAAR